MSDLNMLYLSSYLSKEKFKKIFDECKIKPLQSIQKFNSLLCTGFIENNVNLTVISSMPVNNKMNRKFLFLNENEIVKKINYKYMGFVNLPIVKFLTLFITSFFSILNWCFRYKNSNAIIIYDAFYPIVGNLGAIIGKFFKIKSIALYTDVPKCMNANLNKKNKFKFFLKRLYSYIDHISNVIAEGYILLTEQMNEVVNINNKPYLIIEGLADSGLLIKNDTYNKFDKKTIFYAGGLYEKYGILNLIQAIEKIQDDHVQLILCGEGELVSLLNTKYKNNDKIVYKGSLINEEVIDLEAKSTLLVNPRFTNEEYTKYSFPSKNMEYMISGTPLLTTKLPGMPKEYYEYVYLIEDESVEGLKKIIEQLLAKSNKTKLIDKGKKARDFVLKEKNNIIQSKKIIEFSKDVI